MEIIAMPLLQRKPHRLRVAAYARVSVNSENLLHSLKAQISYYTKLIQSNPEWEFAGIYVDEGVTGTSTKKRDDFLRMMNDAENHKFDLILTKSVTRFARNTVDLLQSVRRLQELNIEVRFEKDHISSFSNDGELVLTLMASFAQAESESISENVKWGKKKQMEQGVYHHFQRCYGYQWQGDHYVIVEEEAKIVRFIFESYLKGLSPTAIANKIDAPTLRGKTFTRGTVKDILKNRTYCGDRILQKYYSPKVRKHNVNYDQLPKYLMTDVHDAIISKKDFERVQEMMEEKALSSPPKTFTCFSGIIKCGHCGRSCCRRVEHGNRYWKCQGNEISKTCHARYIKEDELRSLTFSFFEDEDDFKRKIDSIQLYDDEVVFNLKNGKSKKMKRQMGRRK